MDRLWDIDVLAVIPICGAAMCAVLAGLARSWHASRTWRPYRSDASDCGD